MNGHWQLVAASPRVQPKRSLMNKIFPAVLIASTLASGCASGPVEVPIVDTTVSGDPGITQAFYGKYRVLKGSPVRRLYSLEIYKSAFGKPVLRFYGKDGQLLAMSSPRSCSVKTTPYMVSGDISCGMIETKLFGDTDYPYIDISSAFLSASDSSDIRILYNVQLLKSSKNWYVLTFKWSDYAQIESFLIEKTE